MAPITGLRMTCRTCGVGVTYGERLPFVHTEHRPTNVRPHYAIGVPLRSPVERSTPDSAGALGLGTESGDEVGTLDGSPAAVIPPASGRA